MYLACHSKKKKRNFVVFIFYNVFNREGKESNVKQLCFWGHPEAQVKAGPYKW